MSSTAQFESVRKQYFLVTTYYTMTKRILLLAAVLGVGLLAQPSIYAQEKKAKAAPSPAAATTEAKTPAKKSATKTTHHAKKAAKKEASPKAQ
jgi:outer membrane murein-binding lipoprotein Lpp